MDRAVTAPTPAVPVFTDGTTLTSTQVTNLSQSVEDAIFYMQGGNLRAEKPFVLAYSHDTFVQTVQNATDTVIPFAKVIGNTDNMWVGSLNQFVVNTPGWYRISLQIHYGAEANGYRAARILINGTSPFANAIASDVRAAETTNEGCVLFTSAVAHLNTGANIYASTWQNSGGPLNLLKTFSSSFMSAEWIAAY